jgi:YbbR domain-containing protein
MEHLKGENMTGKILALFLAIVLWVYVMNEQNPPIEQVLNVKVEVRNVAEGLIVTDKTDTMKVRIRGSRGIIAGLRPNDIQIVADARNADEGDHALAIKTSAPGALEIIEVTPATAAVRLERQISRLIAVTPKFSGVPAAGVVINKAVVTPSAVTMSGPRSKVVAADVILVPIDVSGLDKDSIREGAAHAYTKSGAVLDSLGIAPEKVSVALTVLHGLANKTVDVKPVVFGELAPGSIITRLTTDPDKVEIRGQAEVLKTVDWLYTLPVDLTGQNKDVIKEVRLQSREGIIVEKADTIRVMVRITAAVPQR